MAKTSFHSFLFPVGEKKIIQLDLLFSLYPFLLSNSSEMSYCTGSITVITLGCYYCSWTSTFRPLFQTPSFPDSKLSPVSLSHHWYICLKNNGKLLFSLSLCVFLSLSPPLDIRLPICKCVRSTLDSVMKHKVWNGALITVSNKAIEEVRVSACFTLPFSTSFKCLHPLSPRFASLDWSDL